MADNFSDVNTTLTVANQNFTAQMQALITVLGTIFPRVTSLAVGSFTLSAAASTVVPQPLTATNSLIIPVPTNGQAAILQGSARCIFLASKAANTSFTFNTGNGVAAVGNETYAYLLITP